MRRLFKHYAHKSEKEMLRLRTITIPYCMLCLLFFLSRAEAEQIKGQIVIGAPESKPFAGEVLPSGGFYPELIKEIFHRMKYDVKISFLPFKRIIMMLEDGTLAGSALISYQKDRTRFLIYPENALYVDKIKIFGLKTGKTLEKFAGLESLRSSVVGTFRGGFVEQKLSVIGVKYEAVDAHEQNIGKLLLGRIDFIICPEMTLQYLLKHQFSADEQAAVVGYDPPYTLDKHYVAFSKAFPGASEISKDFTRGLHLIQEDGTFDKIKAKYVFSE